MQENDHVYGEPTAEAPADFVKPRGRLNPTRARAMLEAQRASSESVDAFCDRVGVSVKCFERWRARLGRADREATGLARVVVAQGEAAWCAGPMLEIVPGSPAVVRMPAALDEAVLRRVLRACTC